MGEVRIFASVALALAVAACGEKAAPVEEAATSLSAGLYQLDAEVTELTVTGKGTPGTKLKLGDKQMVKACVSAGGRLAPELLAEEGDSCSFKDNYVRNGRISAQLACTRKGVDGQIAPMIDGTFKADSFEGQVTTNTYLYDHANYRLIQKVSAKRLGDCPPAAPAKDAA